MAEREIPNRMTALGLLEQMRRANANREPEFNPISATLRERRAGPSAPLFGGQRQQAPLPIPPRPPAVIPPQQTQQGAPQAAAAPQARTPAQALPVPPRPPQLGADGNPVEIPPALLPQVPGAEPQPLHARFNPENPYVATATQMAERYGLPPNVFLSLVHRESGFRPDAVSRVGAMGLGQLMPGTARDLGVDPNDPMQNLEGSARYLRQQFDRFGGDMPLALAAYNAGPRRVAEAGNTIPNIAETQAYVPAIMRNAGMPGYAMGGLAELEHKYSKGGLNISDEEYDRRLRARLNQDARRTFRGMRQIEYLDGPAVGQMTRNNPIPIVVESNDGPGAGLMTRSGPVTVTVETRDGPGAGQMTRNNPLPIVVESHDGPGSGQMMRGRPAPRPAPREELTADQLNDMVLDRIAGRAAAASEAGVAAEARDRIRQTMGYAEGGLAHLEQKYSEGGPVASLPTYDINVRANRIRTPRRAAPREELTAGQLNGMVLDAIARRAAAEPESAVAAEARDRIGRTMGYAEGGRVNSDWSRYLPEDMPESAYSDRQNTMTRPLNVRRLIDAGAIRITDPAGDPSGEGFSVVSRWNDVSPESVTPRWADRPSALPSAINALSSPGSLVDGKYRQILQSARELGLSPDEVFLPERENRAEGGLADLHQKYARGGEEISDEEYDRHLLERMKRDTGRTTESTNAEQAAALRSAGYDAARLASDIFLPQSPMDAALMVALGPGGRMARLAGSTALMAMEPSEAEAIISPRTARSIRIATRLPQDVRFREAVEATPGASITDDGLSLEVMRYQKPEQAGAQAIREGVFYFPATLPPRGGTYRGGSSSIYGGPESVRGETLLRAPLAVPGNTGGVVPERAFRELTSDANMRRLERESRSAATAPLLGAEYRENIENFLNQWGGNPNVAHELVSNSRAGNRMPFALREHVIGNRARQEGYDSIVGTGARTPRITEVFDLREAAYPVPGSPEFEMLLPRFEDSRYAQGGLAQLEHKYAEGGAVSAQPAIYDPDAVNTLANQIEAGYV